MKAMSYQQCYLYVIRLNISVTTIAATLYLYTTDHLAHHNCASNGASLDGLQICNER